MVRTTETVSSVAIHPTDYFVAVGTGERKFRFPFPENDSDDESLSPSKIDEEDEVYRLNGAQEKDQSSSTGSSKRRKTERIGSGRLCSQSVSPVKLSLCVFTGVRLFAFPVKYMERDESLTSKTGSRAEGRHVETDFTGETGSVELVQTQFAQEAASPASPVQHSHPTASGGQEGVSQGIIGPEEYTTSV